MKLPASLQSTLQTRWASVAPREKAMLAAAAGLIVLAVVWWLFPILLGGQFFGNSKMKNTSFSDF